MKRVDVNLSPQVLEASRALQAANRERLVRRERDERIKNEAERQARQARSQIGDPKNRGVPEIDDPPFSPLWQGKQFNAAGAYCQVELGGVRVFTSNRSTSAFLTVPGLPNPYSCAFPSFVMAMPGGKGRTVLTFYFDTWDYSKLEIPYEFGSNYYESRPGSTITVVDTRVRTGQLYQQNWYWVIPRQFTGPNFYVEWKASYSIVEETRQSGIGSRIAKVEEVQKDIDNTSQILISCVVTTDRVFSVPTPQALATALNRIYPRQKPVIEIRETPLTGQIEQITEIPYFETYTSNGISITELRVAATRTMVDLPAGKLESIHFSYPQDLNFYNKLLLASYGYGRLLNVQPTTERRNIKSFIFGRLAAMKALREANSPGQDSIKNEITQANAIEVALDERGFATPATFAFLSRYSGEFNGTNEEPALALNYQYISDNYFPDDAVEYMLTVGYQPQGANVDETTEIFYFRPLADYSSFEAPPIPPRRNQGSADARTMAAVPLVGAERQAFNPLWDWKVVREMKIAGYRDDLILSAAASGPTAVNTWDWGRPLACILELLNLGFSPAALMLTEEELEAVANATPADRFSFSSSPP